MVASTAYRRCQVSTYTVKWRDADDGDHTFTGMQDTSVAAFISALVIHPDMTLISVTLDERDDTKDLVQ
jgi:hypothetical protein